MGIEMQGRGMRRGRQKRWLDFRGRRYMSERHRGDSQRAATPVCGLWAASPVCGLWAASLACGLRVASPVCGLWVASPVCGLWAASPVCGQRAASPVCGQTAGRAAARSRPAPAAARCSRPSRRLSATAGPASRGPPPPASVSPPSASSAPAQTLEGQQDVNRRVPRPRSHTGWLMNDKTPTMSSRQPVVIQARVIAL